MTSIPDIDKTPAAATSALLTAKLEGAFEPDIPQAVSRAAIEAALAEDLGLAGDLTSQSIFSKDEEASARIVAREAGCIAGLPLAEATFSLLDPEIFLNRSAIDGDRVSKGQTLLTVKGRARGILSAERVALNFLGHLSGVASKTAGFVDAVAGTGASICCTRKTTPGLRALEKYAVRAGGGVNHRFGLFDAVLIKDNHIAAAGGIKTAVEAARGRVGHLVKVEIEVDTLEQLEAALHCHIDAVLLDNMDPEMLQKAVRMVRDTGRRIVCEASGGVTLETVLAIAETGVDLISVGGLTHSADSLDLGLDFDTSAG